MIRRDVLKALSWRTAQAMIWGMPVVNLDPMRAWALPGVDRVA